LLNKPEVGSSILFFNEEISFVLKNKTGVRHWLNRVIQAEKWSTGMISFIFCTDEFLLKLNNAYLQHDTLTDILTFPSEENPGEVSGEIYISIERVRENALLFSQKFDQELKRVMVHGVLHLMGYSDHGKERKKMTLLEDRYLEMVE
jgi:probable rRNA maturation factor